MSRERCRNRRKEVKKSAHPKQSARLTGIAAGQSKVRSQECHPVKAAHDMQEQKYKRQQGLDGAEPWTVSDEKALSATNAMMSQAYVFCKVKR